MQRRPMLWFAVMVIVFGLLALLLTPAAHAQSAGPSVTIQASPTTVLFGRSTLLSGTVSPVRSDERVVIKDAAGTVLASVLPTAAGAYSATYTPRRNARVHAEWAGATSNVVSLFVRPRLTARMGQARLFGRTWVSGRLTPAHPGHSVVVRLVRWGTVVARKRVRLRDGQYYSTSFYIGRPGRYHARVFFDDLDHAAAEARTGADTTPLPYLRTGSRNIYVDLLERRLRYLAYHLTGINRTYDRRTADAVRAFNKVQGRRRVGYVSSSTWWALARPFRPRPRAGSPYYHIEVNQTKQVLYRVRGGKVISILHVSTGRNGATRNGNFRFWREIYGYSPNRLYYPSYFDGWRATHGWPQVPTYPASHGCVRVPMWAAVWLNSTIRVGDRIIIYR